VTLRNVKGKLRQETPQLKDLPVSLAQPAPDPSEGRDEGGRFGPGNRHGLGQGWKATIRKSLGAMAGDLSADGVVRQATTLYIATLRSLPSDGPSVRALVAGQCRHVAIATHYANEAARVGLATETGLKLAEAARAHDKTAQGLSVAAYDRSTREAAARPRAPSDPLAKWRDPK
jgi:hypothetical protein